MGLRVKLFLVWFALLLAPLAILGSIGYVYISSQLHKEVINHQVEVGHLMSHEADEYLSRMGELTEFAATHPQVVGFLGEESYDNQRLSQGQAMASSMFSANESLIQSRMIKGDGFESPLVISSSPHMTSKPVVRRGLLADMVANNDRATHVPAADKDAPGYLLNLRAVIDADSKAGNPTPLGYFVLVTSMKPLLAVLEHQLGSGVGSLLVQGSGDIVARSNDIPLTRLPEMETLYQNTVDGIIPDHELNGKSYMLRVNPVAENFWLVSMTDNQKLFEEKLPYIIIFAMTLSLTLLISGVVFNFITNSIAVKPIEQLINATRQIAKGDFKPELNIDSKDEVGELAIAFRQMGKQLMHTSRRIRQLAYFDPLTQLPNRTTLRETLNRLLSRAERSKTKSAVLFIDLDDFKKVNDRLGHEAGDKLLVQISDRLKNRLRQADVLFEQAGVTSVDQLISRRGGDEFNAILSTIKAAHDAAIVAERFIQDLNEPFFINKSEIHVGASVGIAIFPDDGRDADTLLRNADLAMYEAKARGKNNYHIFTSAINEQVHQRLALEHSLQLAMVQNQFCLYYQPKVNLLDMRPVGFEALIRWQHPEKGLILPSRFIPVAEESNLIRDIGNWILGESMQQIQSWGNLLPNHLRIAVNISARQLSQVDLVDQLQTVMENFSIPPERLEIELTETSVLQDETMAIQHLTALRDLNIEISLDDFGTGYSSLSFLRKLPIDTVKIDRSFTANMIQNSETRAIVVSLLGLCRELNVKTIAEGIETTAQLQFLMEHGCEQGQGFLFSEPLPADEVVTFLQEPNIA